MGRNLVKPLGGRCLVLLSRRKCGSTLVPTQPDSPLRIKNCAAHQPSELRALTSSCLGVHRSWFGLLIRMSQVRALPGEPTLSATCGSSVPPPPLVVPLLVPVLEPKRSSVGDQRAGGEQQARVRVADHRAGSAAGRRACGSDDTRAPRLRLRRRWCDDATRETRVDLVPPDAERS